MQCSSEERQSRSYYIAVGRCGSSHTDVYIKGIVLQFWIIFDEDSLPNQVLLGKISNDLSIFPYTAGERTKQWRL